jgi:hypothetical protein
MVRNIKIAAAAAACASLHAAAQSAPEPWWQHRFYLEASGGQSKTSDDLVSQTESAITNGSGIRSDFDSKDTAWKAGVGYRLLPWLALEVNYADLGRAKVATTLSASGAPASIDIDRKVDGWGVDAVFSWPFAPAFSLYGRAGAFRANVETSQTLGGNIVFGDTDPQLRSRALSRHETVGRGAVGLRWFAWRNGGVHVEYERYSDVGDAFHPGYTRTTGRADIDAWWVGITQAF